MESSRQQKLIKLAMELQKLEQQIVKERIEKGKEDLNLRKAFIDIENEIKEILGDSGILDKINNPRVIDILRKVRSGNFFTIDKEARQLENLFKKFPELVKRIYADKKIEVTEDEIDKKLEEDLFKFQLEITDRIDYSDYFDRKDKISTIIVNRQLPSKIHKYFDEVKACFLYGQMLAVLGLCRVIIELGLKERYRELGLVKKQSNVIYIEDESISKYNPCGLHPA